jgi:hypothetical protein
MTADRAGARPWHVSSALLDGTPPLGRSDARRPPPATVTATRQGRPLQVVIVGINRVLAAILWRRRRVARRAVRWLDRHPDFRRVLANQGVLRFGGFTVTSAWATGAGRRSQTARRHPYRPRIEVPPGLDIAGLGGSVALAGVDLSVQPATPSNHRADFVNQLIEVRSLETESDVVADLQLLDAVDLAVWNPRWFRVAPSRNATRLRELPQGRRRRRIRARATIANRSQVVMCEDDRAASPAVAARSIAQLAVSGTPLAGDIAEPVAALLGADVTALIRATRTEHLHDNDRRERYSIDLRRAALDSLSPRGRWRVIGAAGGEPGIATPSVTVLLASNRPDDVIEAARQVAAQRGCAVQLVVGLHGSHMSRQLDDQLADAFTGDLVVRHLPDHMNLGQVMNALTADAEGELVAKWDDDDWYDARHLTDLISALEYSGADLVAKAAEFVYLESLDLTVRRFAVGSERWSTTVAGGTMLLTRAELQRVGWADAPRRIDRLLIDALEDRAGRVYRTHGFGYVLRRRSAVLGSHTWQAGDAYFLRQSVDQRAGLDLPFAGFTAQPVSGTGS